MREIIFLTFAIFIACCPAKAQNSYDSNLVVRLTSVITYTEQDDILFTIESPPQLSQCGPYFLILGTLPDARRAQLLSRLLTAYSSNSPINIGYDGSTCGPGGYFRVFRVG